MTEQQAFETWAIVEVMGHARFAGYVSEQALGGANFVRVDVPEVPADQYYGPRPAFTKLFGAGSIYSITPCDEQVARHAAKEFRARPVTCVAMPEAPRLTSAETSASLPVDFDEDAGAVDEEDDEYDYEGDSDN